MREEEMVVALVAIGCTFGLPFLGFVCWLVLHYLFSAFRTWQETGLKRDMIARGYTVQEIVEVVSARRGKSKGKGKDCDVPPAKPIKHPAYAANH